MPRTKYGLLNVKTMTKIQFRGYKAWKDQGQRCENPNDPLFYTYGARGIKREYSPVEFVAWYEREWAKIPEEWKKKRVHCGRIDHDKNYAFGNVRLEPIGTNVAERNSRHGNPMLSKPVRMKNTETGEIREFPSKREAARELGISRGVIRYQSKHGITRRAFSGWLLLPESVWQA